MSIPCPRVAGSVADFGAEHPDKYRDCTALPLRRHWQAPDAIPVEVVGTDHPVAVLVGVYLDDFFACLVVHRNRSAVFITF